MNDVWLYHVAEDVSGLTFLEWNPSVDTDASQTPEAMIVNSSELTIMLTTDFDLREVIPLQLETETRGDQRTCDDTLKQIQVMSRQTIVCLFKLVLTDKARHKGNTYIYGEKFFLFGLILPKKNWSLW